MFAVSEAKREILRELAERDWSPTDLAAEIGKSPETIYNHLNDLEEQGVLSKTRVAAKTRPKTEYSIGRGLIQYITVLPGQFHEGTLNVTGMKEVMFRIWTIPQDEFHPYLERYWWSILLDSDIDLGEDVLAAGVFGSVARGDASENSDIDILVVTSGEGSKSTLEDVLGSAVLRFEDKTRLGMTEFYTAEELRNSLAHGSDFLTAALDEIHLLFDPERILREPTGVPNE